MAWDAIALGWLVRAAACGFVILGAAAVAVRFCRQPADRLRVIGLALAAALVAPWLALAPWLPRWSVVALPAETAAVQEPETVPLQATSGSAPESRPVSAPLPPRNEFNEEQPRSTPPERSTTPATPEPRPVAAFAEIPPPAPRPPWWTTGRVVLAGYGAATAALLMWSLLGLSRLYLLRRNARPAPAEVAALMRQIAGPDTFRVRLLVSDRVEAPVAFGVWRPVIVLPASACDPAEREALRYGLAHEWSHVERGDVRRWYVVAFAQLFLFYQPAFWWLRRQLRLGQDYLADARAAGLADEPTDYAAYLVALARRRLGVPGFALGIAGRRSNLTWRVHMLLLNRTPLSRRCRIAWSCGAALVALGLVAGLAAVRVTAADPPKAEAKPDDAKKPTEPVKGETLNYSGVVTDKDTKKPIAGATVTVRRSLLGDPELNDRNPVMEESKHTTDANGKYSFVIPPEQSSKRYLYIELDVEHPEYAPQKGFGYALSMIRKNEKLGGRPFFESVDLRPGKPVTGVVKTPDGKPAAGVKLLAYSVTSKRESGNFEYGSFADSKTDAEGKFKLPLVTPGWAVVWVLPEQYVPTTHVVKDKRGDLGTFTLQTGPRLKGTVLDAKGQPLAGVIVNAESRDRNDEITEPVADAINRSAVTNDKGEFEMNPLPPGNYLVKPGDHARDGSLDRKDRRRMELPGVFIGTKVVLTDKVPEPIEVRAVPHVTIEAQYVDGQGKPTRGHAPHVGGRIDGVFWFAEAKADPNGKVTAMVPHGLEEVSFDLITNEHSVIRWRKAKGEPLNNTRTVRLGTLTDDVKGIEIIRYTAPILLVKVTIKDGVKPKDLAVTANYTPGKGRNEGQFVVRGGRGSDLSFEEQEDGRFRSSQMFPDEEVSVRAHAEGYTSTSVKATLAEGTTKEVEVVLVKTPEKKDGEKKDK